MKDTWCSRDARSEKSKNLCQSTISHCTRTASLRTIGLHPMAPITFSFPKEIVQFIMICLQRRESLKPTRTKLVENSGKLCSISGGSQRQEDTKYLVVECNCGGLFYRWANNFSIFSKSGKIKSNATLQCKVIRIGISILQKNGDFIERQPGNSVSLEQMN